MTPKTTVQQLDDYTTWAMDAWDRMIDAALIEFGAGQKTTPQQKAADTRDFRGQLRQAALRMDEIVGPDTPIPGG